MPYLMQQDQRGVTVQGWELGPTTKVFGRGEEADMQIADDAMSRKHFAIEFQDGGHQVVDQNSTNGTRLNDERVRAKRLKAGDVIRAGNTKFVYDIGTSTMIKEVEKESGRDIRSELHDIYKKLDES